MSDSLPDLEPPSETLAALLRADRAVAQAAPDDLAARQAQVLARLSATLGPLDAPVAPAPPAGAPTPAPPAAAPPPGTSFLTSMFTKGGLTMLALGALAGGATTAAVSANAPPAPPVVLAAPATSASFAAPVFGPSSVEATPARVANETAVPTSPAQSAPSVAADPGAGARKLGLGADARGADGRDPELERERALLDVARGAIARGNADLALRSLDDHRTRFPQGRLAEDREALRIKALVAAGRTNEADRSRSAFVAKYPDSFALPRGAGSAVSVPPEKTPTAKEKHDALTDPFARRQ